MKSLIKTLVDFPSLQVLILGNSTVNTDQYVDRNTSVKVDGRYGTIGELQLARAKSIQRFLRSRGVNLNRVKVGNGIINNSQTIVPTATFIISK